MRILSQIKGGADLSKPELSPRWMLGAFFGIALLIVIAAFARKSLNFVGEKLGQKGLAMPKMEDAAPAGDMSFSEASTALGL